MKIQSLEFRKEIGGGERRDTTLGVLNITVENLERGDETYVWIVVSLLNCYSCPKCLSDLEKINR